MAGATTISNAERLCRRFGVTWAQSKLLLRLYEAAGGLVGFDDLLEAIAHPASGQETLKVQVCHARKRLGRSAIENQWGRGYRLSEKGVEKLRRVIG